MTSTSDLLALMEQKRREDLSHAANPLLDLDNQEQLSPDMRRLLAARMANYELRLRHRGPAKFLGEALRQGGYKDLAHQFRFAKEDNDDTMDSSAYSRR